MTKYCAINLNARYRLGFQYSRDGTYVFSKKLIDFIQNMYLHDITLLRRVADDLLKFEKN